MIEHRACNVGCLSSKPNGTDSNCWDLKGGVDFSIDLDFWKLQLLFLKMKYLFTEIIFFTASITVIMRYFLIVVTDLGFCNVPTCVVLIVTWNEGERVSIHVHYFEFLFF